MSQENVEIVHRVFEEYALHGIQPASELLAPDIVWNPADEAPQHGQDGVRAYMERWEREWEGLKTTPEDFIDAGDRVVVTVHFTARGRGSGIEVEARTYEVFTVRDGVIVRMDEFTERPRALEAAGVSE
jgi:uncharacterized protein